MAPIGPKPASKRGVGDTAAETHLKWGLLGRPGAVQGPRKSLPGARVGTQRLQNAPPWRSFGQSDVMTDSSGHSCARPSSNRRPIVVKCLSKSSRPTCFVNKSAGLLSPFTLLMLRSLTATRCWSHSKCTAKCRNLPSPLLLAMALAAEASVFRLIPTFSPRSK